MSARIAKDAPGLGRRPRVHAYAATRLPAKSVGTAQLKTGAVTGAKIKDGTITGAKVDSRTLGPVPTALNATSATGTIVARTPARIITVSFNASSRVPTSGTGSCAVAATALAV